MALKCSIALAERGPRPHTDPMIDLDSPLFDRIRVRPKAEQVHAPAGPPCQHAGCVERGEFRAPKGREQEGKFWLFCIDHVREYNSSYNYFDGMNDAQVAEFQKDAVTGHRPTWKMGVNSWGQEAEGENVKRYAERLRTHGNGRSVRQHYN